MSTNEIPSWHGTAILTVRKGGTVVIGGDVLEPENGVMGIGSGGNYALSAARALLDGALDAEAIVRKSLDIAADICVYTNRNVTIEALKS
jgi:ATP-dependent HslUV protease subunit HslV